MIGYKAFNNDLTCLGYQFTIDEPHVFDGTPILCKQGFHFCSTLEDVVKYYNSPNMRVFEIEASGVITDAKDNCSNRACSEIRLVKEISLDEVMLSITKSEPAYYWAKGIGNKDIMINHIKDSEWAFRWAYYICNQDTMIKHITESKYAYYWASNIGNKDIMIDRITESEWAFYWAGNIGNEDIMINHITDSEYAFYWAMEIGNQDIMKSKVTVPHWIDRWNNRFPNNKINKLKKGVA